MAKRIAFPTLARQTLATSDNTRIPGPALLTTTATVGVLKCVVFFILFLTATVGLGSAVMMTADPNQPLPPRRLSLQTVKNANREALQPLAKLGAAMQWIVLPAMAAKCRP